MESRIEVSRRRLPHPVRDGVRAYNVVLDGTVVSKVSMGETVAFSCEPGLHSLWIKIDFKRSSAINFTVEPDWTARFECEPGGRYFMALLDVFRAGKYVRVRQLGQVRGRAS